jgi:hypothetical protein
MPVPVVPFIAAAQILLVASSGGPPGINVQKTCRSSENEITKIFGSKTVVTYDTCMRQENEALDQIRKNWASYPAEDRTHCVQPRAYMPSYVEWLTCFEMHRDVRQMRLEKPAA